MTNPLATMQTLTFGVEIETINLNRQQLAEAIKKGLADVGVVAEIRATHDSYDRHMIRLPDGREWATCTDASLSGGRYGRNGEVVTPIMTYADLPALQSVARALHTAGARTDASCGVHVHVGAGSLCRETDSRALVRLAKLVYQQEPLIFEALAVQGSRRGQWCRPVEESLIHRIASQRPVTRAAMARAWYDGGSTYAQREHYNQTRYHGLNLHSVFYRGTVEFRYFEATLHAGKIKSYVQFCLAMVAKAMSAKGAVARKRTFNAATAKYDFRVFLLRLGLIGEEFKTLRHHLLGGLQGSASWKHGAPARPICSGSPGLAAEAAEDMNDQDPTVARDVAATAAGIPSISTIYPD